MGFLRVKAPPKTHKDSINNPTNTFWDPDTKHYVGRDGQQQI